jgi:uncharacterized membrane protein YcgQ (UPF0703/DUF1980 family)
MLIQNILLYYIDFMLYYYILLVVIYFILYYSIQYSAWKAKVRKYASQNKKLDESKIAALALEASSLPFTSRLKTLILQLAKKQGSIPSVTTTSNEGESAAPVAPTTGKRSYNKSSLLKPNAAASAANTGASGNTNNAITTTNSGKVILDDLAHSSDEEDNFQRCRSGKK